MKTLCLILTIAINSALFSAKEPEFTSFCVKKHSETERLRAIEKMAKKRAPAIFYKIPSQKVARAISAELCKRFYHVYTLGKLPYLGLTIMAKNTPISGHSETGFIEAKPFQLSDFGANGGVISIGSGSAVITSDPVESGSANSYIGNSTMQIGENPSLSDLSFENDEESTTLPE